MRKFLVKATLKKESGQYLRKTVIDSTRMGLEREIEIFANNADDAKVRAKALLAKEGYDEKLLHRASWTVSRLDYQHKG
jgi:hypothetical protein